MSVCWSLVPTQNKAISGAERSLFAQGGELMRCEFPDLLRLRRCDFIGADNAVKHQHFEVTALNCGTFGAAALGDKYPHSEAISAGFSIEVQSNRQPEKMNFINAFAPSTGHGSAAGNAEPRQ